MFKTVRLTDQFRVQGAERPAGGGAQQRHTGQSVERVNRAGGSVVNGGSQQRHARDLGGATSTASATQGCSSDGSLTMARGQNVIFFKAGNFHKRGKKRRHNVSLGSCRPALARASQTEQRNITETITVELDSSDNESLQEMEEKLARMLEMKFKRRRGQDSLE